jgi:hypothetical protein
MQQAKNDWGKANPFSEHLPDGNPNPYYVGNNSLNLTRRKGAAAPKPQGKATVSIPAYVGPTK